MKQISLIKPQIQDKRRTKMQRLMETIAANDKGKFDLITPLQALEFTDEGMATPTLVDREHERHFELDEWAYGQVCFRLGMPSGYMKKLPLDLQVPHFQHWLGTTINADEKSREVLLRARENDGGRPNTLRAFLSGKYGILDNKDAVQMLYDVAKDVDWKWHVQTAHLSDRSMVARLVFGDRKLLATKDDLMPGLVLSNSEVGALQVTIGMMVYRLACTNGMIVGESIWEVKRKHIGGADGQFAERIKTLLGEVPNAVVRMEGIVSIAEKKMIAESYMAKLEARTSKKFMEVVASTVASEYGGQNTHWALANAISRRSQDSVSAEKRLDYDELAGEVLLKAAA